MKQIKYRVKFGNPCLETYGGCVYTSSQSLSSNFNHHAVQDSSSLETHFNLNTKVDNKYNQNKILNNDCGGSSSSSTNFPENDVYSRIVAICDVPPNELPEGVLNLARSHRSFIEHMRIVVSESSHFYIENEKEEEKGKDDDDISNSHDCAKNNVIYKSPTTTSTLEHAAKILANEEKNQQHDLFHNNTLNSMMSKVSIRENKESLHNMLGTTSIIYSEEEEKLTCSNKNKSFLVLVALRTEQAAKDFVLDLNGKPFTTLQKDVLATVCHVRHMEMDQHHERDDCYDLFHHHPATRNATAMNATTIHQDQNQNHDFLLDGLSFTNQNLQINTHQKNIQNDFTSSCGDIQNNCPVCLEKMEIPCWNEQKESTLSLGTTKTSSTFESLFTTACNHTFHIECLLKCQDSPCPVCRYDHSGLNDKLSSCHACGSTENIYVCLICGIASCWVHNDDLTSFIIKSMDSSGDNNEANYDCINVGDQDCNQSLNSSSSTYPRSTKFTSVNELETTCHNMNIVGGHARQHYTETLHAYALDTETQHVFDFVGNGYVHRIIQNADDGKLVEVNNPIDISSSNGERSLIPELSDVQEGEVVHRKLEGFAGQYYSLLKGQLEQQRLYYESVLAQIELDHEEKRSRDDHNNILSSFTTKTSSGLIAALKQDRNNLQQRCFSLKKKHQKLLEDVSFLKNMNESLEANKEPMNHEIMNAKREREEYAALVSSSIPSLEKKVQMLMLQLESEMDDE